MVSAHWNWLKAAGVETHLVISTAAFLPFLRKPIESGRNPRLQIAIHPADNIGATIASGSFMTQGMIIAPCSIQNPFSVANLIRII
jgi:4-hydroxy-3-polyprenylbenzoate decarboxylase